MLTKTIAVLSLSVFFSCSSLFVFAQEVKQEQKKEVKETKVDEKKVKKEPINTLDIKVQLNTEEEINAALNKIKRDDPPYYEKLIGLQDKKPEEFKKLLYNRYYSMLHRDKMLARKNNRIKGYRELLSESESKFVDLKKKYKELKNEEEKTKLKAEIKKVAEERFQIELDFIELRAQKAKAYYEMLQNKSAEFEKNKDKYVDRVVNKVV